MYSEVHVDGVLHCPECDGTYLHQFGFEWFDRAHEDDDRGFHIRSLGHNDLHVDTDISRNPSSRRDGLRIWFFCESCSSDHEGPYFGLSIAQRKGETLFGWEEKMNFHALLLEGQQSC